MPELPDIVVYIENLESRILGNTLKRVRLLNPFVLRTAVPANHVRRGQEDRWPAATGQAHRHRTWRAIFSWCCTLWLQAGCAGSRAKARLPGRIALAAFDFDNGTLVFTEAGTKRRASIHLVQGEAAVSALHAGGMEVLESDHAAFSQRLKAENHTLKRALTDPHIFSGIGNAYSDEILHRARLSPIALTGTSRATKRFRACSEAIRSTLEEWTDLAEEGSRRRVSGKSHRLSRWHGGARPLRPALSGVRLAGAAHRLRRQRDQLLRPLPDRRQDPRRSRAIAAAQEKLAALLGRNRVNRRHNAVSGISGNDAERAPGKRPVACAVVGEHRGELGKSGQVPAGPINAQRVRL